MGYLSVGDLNDRLNFSGDLVVSLPRTVPSRNLPAAPLSVCLILENPHFSKSFPGQIPLAVSTMSPYPVEPQ